MENSEVIRSISQNVSVNGSHNCMKFCERCAYSAPFQPWSFSFYRLCSSQDLLSGSFGSLARGIATSEHISEAVFIHVDTLTGWLTATCS